MNYCVYLIDIMKDVSKVVDYLKVGSLQHVRSYFWWGGIEIEQLHRGRYKSKKLLNNNHPLNKGHLRGYLRGHSVELTTKFFSHWYTCHCVTGTQKCLFSGEIKDAKE